VKVSSEILTGMNRISWTGRINTTEPLYAWISPFLHLNDHMKLVS
jgi:hypothetical protein